MIDKPITELYFQDWFYRRCLGWQLKLVLWPTRCDISGKWLWLEYAYQGYSILTGPGDPIEETRWHDKAEHLVWKLKGN